MNGRAAPPASQQGLPMAPPQRPPGAAPPGMAPPGMPPPAGAYVSSRAGAGGPPSGAPPPYSTYPGRRSLMHDINDFVLDLRLHWKYNWMLLKQPGIFQSDSCPDRHMYPQRCSQHMQQVVAGAHVGCKL